jgi:DNA mismatch repair protein MutS2
MSARLTQQMRLDEYWGVGSKTRRLFTESLGAEAAAEAIGSGDVRTLVEAGLPHGRATRILRHVNDGAALDLLATPDTRDVYKQLLELVSEHAVTAEARDRVRVLTPLATRAAMVDRLDTVLAARDGWTALAEHRRERALDIFETYDDAGGDRRAAVETALSAREAGLDSGVFGLLADLSTHWSRHSRRLRGSPAVAATVSARGPTTGSTRSGDSSAPSRICP